MTRHVPEWVNREYGGHGQSWWEAVDQCRAILIAWAAGRQLSFYKELSEGVTAIPWPEGPHTHEGSQIGWLLGQVAATEWADGRPLLSAVCIGSETRRPSEGFFKLATELGELPSGASEARREGFWVAEVDRCFSEWNSP